LRESYGGQAAGPLGQLNKASRRFVVCRRLFPRPGARIAIKVINHLGDEVMKVFRVG
jgi:hypothetical protein